jgi:DNA invertase Pin-like site-specific DNA recombinase
MSDAKPVALYARVSTSDQKPAVQLRQLRRYARDRAVEGREFVDHGVSGARDSRPSLDLLLEAARRREVSAIVCTKLDRLARSTRHLCNLAAEFEALGVDLVLLDMAVDTSTPMGRLLFTVLAGFAEFERELIRDRTKLGMDNARRQGKRIGRPPALGKRELTRAQRMRKAGKSLRHIGQVLGVSHATVMSALRAT